MRSNCAIPQKINNAEHAQAHYRVEHRVSTAYSNGKALLGTHTRARQPMTHLEINWKRSFFPLLAHSLSLLLRDKYKFQIRWAQNRSACSGWTVSSEHCTAIHIIQPAEHIVNLENYFFFFISSIFRDVLLSLSLRLFNLACIVCSFRTQKQQCVGRRRPWAAKKITFRHTFWYLLINSTLRNLLSLPPPPSPSRLLSFLLLLPDFPRPGAHFIS